MKKNTNSAVRIFLVVILLTAFVSSTLITDGQESTAEKKERMLNQFNNRMSFVPGVIVVSFGDSTEKSQAENILEKYGLSIQKMTVCDETKRDGTYEERGCQEIDRWDERLKVAHVEVPSEEEKKYAEILIDEEIVVWIEPVFAVEVAGDSEGIDDGEAGCTKELKICDDGSNVGRNPDLNCGFDACPQDGSAETGLFSRFVNWLKEIFS